MFEKLNDLLQRKSQRFICRDGWPEPSPPVHIVAIEHKVGPRIAEDVLSTLEEQLDIPPQLTEFYSRFGYVRLYSQVDSDESAYYIASPDEWDELNDSFFDWIEDFSEDEKEELLPDWISEYIVIGEIPASGNYLLMPLTGDHKGRVFEFEHDGFEFIERGRDFADFLDVISTVTDQLLEDIAGHTRYQDQRPDSQWLVTEYEFEL